MSDINDVIKQFANLREFSDFLGELVEAADGQEIARGMNPNDKSKQEKSGQSQTEGGPEASASDTPSEPGGPGGPEQGEAGEVVEGEAPEGESPTIDPVAAPGSQVSIGKKVESRIHKKPKTKALDVKGSEKVSVDTKPNIEVDPRFM